MRTKILVIDDEEALCDILKFNLEKEGYEVDCAYSAEEALDLDNLDSYSLFLVDIMMGQLSGFDFANRVRNVTATEQTPILFCSALTDEDCVVKGLNIGADDYVTKPFNIGEVLARVRAVLRRAKAAENRSK
ncbi:MAG: response regulator transcription factor, partial [Muribaculaceae bacterium]|nr:response regulator transcription factor [Muribaculaceae bacterium]